MKDSQKQLSNPFSTGGGGPSFETRVQAAFVVTMLTGRVAPCLPAWPINKIKLQGRYAGFNTDDCIVYVHDTETSRDAKLLAQIKHSIAVTETDEAFSEAISAAWNDFSHPETFVEGSDEIALITGPLSATDTKDVRPLMEWARHCATADEFVAKVGTAKFSSQSKRNKLGVIRGLLDKANGSPISDDLLWRFLKGFNLISYDLDAASSITVSLLEALISQSCVDQQPKAIWTQIVDFVQGANQSAGTITPDNIPENIRLCFSARASRHWESDLTKLRDHSEYVLQAIHDSIEGVHIDRQDILHQLVDLAERNSLVLLTGGRGCGKSSIVKEFAEFARIRNPVFCIRTEDLNQPSLDHAFSAMGLHSSITEITAGFAVMPKRYLLIESLEKLLELDHKTAFHDLMHFVRTHPGWVIVASIRDYAFQQLTFGYLQPHGMRWSPIEIPEFTDADLDVLSSQIPALKTLVSNPVINKLLHTPFLTELAVRVVMTGTQLSVSDGEEAFRNAVWRDVIAKENDRSNGLPVRRKRTFVDIAVRRAKAMTYGVPENEFDAEAMLALDADHLIQRDPSTGLVSPAHDVLEDWALDAFVEDAFQRNRRNVTGFIEAVGLEPAMNRAFRLWLHRRLPSDGHLGEIRDLVMTILQDESLQAYCRDEVITAILMGEDPIAFLHRLDNHLFENEAALLKRFLFVLRVSCKAPDHRLIEQLSSADADLGAAAESLYMRPYGSGWEAMIRFLHENKERITLVLVTHIAGLLEDWASLIHIEQELPSPGREAGLLAIHMFEMASGGYRLEGDKKRILSVVLRSVAGITDEVSQLLEQCTLEEPERHRRGIDEGIAALALLGFAETAFLCKHMPDQVIKLARHKWTNKVRDNSDPWFRHIDVEECFGLPKFGSDADFFPASGAKGPFSHLLRRHPCKGLEFIIDLCNRSAESYAHCTLDTRDFGSDVIFEPEASIPMTDITLNDGSVIQQYYSERLWLGYRGTSVLPYLLQSALMALENWLIEVAQQWGICQSTERTIDYIIRHSNSVMATAVIASVAEGFPDVMGVYALPLLRTPILYELDLIRKVKEASALNPSGAFDPLDDLYRNERKVAHKRPWRTEHLENLAFRLQFSELKNEMFKILDGFEDRVRESETTSDETSWRFRLHRMDIRKLDPQLDEQNSQITFTPKSMEPDLQDIQDRTQNEHATRNRFLTLMLWADGILRNEPVEREYFADWHGALDEARSLLRLWNEGNVPEASIVHYGGMVKASAVFLQDHSADIDDEDLEWCVGLVVEAALANADTEDRLAQADASGLDGAPSGASVLPILLDLVEEEDERRQVRLIIATALTHANDHVRGATAEGINRHLWSRDSAFAKTCINGAIEHSKLWLEAIHNRNRYWEEQADLPSRPESWLVNLREKIADYEADTEIEDISFVTHSAWHILEPCLMIPEGSTEPEHLALMSKVLLLLIDHESRKKLHRYREPKVEDIPVELAIQFPQRLALYLLGSTEQQAEKILGLLVSSWESAPDLLSSFIVYFTGLADRHKAYIRYWRFWREIAEKAREIAIILNAMNVDSLLRDDRGKAIRHILFVETSWQRTDVELELMEPGAEAILEFARSSAGNPLVFQAMARLLFYFPNLFMPTGLVTLAAHQEAATGNQLAEMRNTVFYLERVIQRLLIIDENHPGIPDSLRRASLTLLNAMIETGSSSVYFLRDYLLHSLRVV